MIRHLGDDHTTTRSQILFGATVDGEGDDISKFVSLRCSSMHGFAQLHAVRYQKDLFANTTVHPAIQNGVYNLMQGKLSHGHPFYVHAGTDGKDVGRRGADEAVR